MRSIRFVSRQRALIVCSFALVLAPACKMADAKTYNLRELHEEDGHHKRTAALYVPVWLLGDMPFAFQQLKAAIFKGTKLALATPKPKKVEDPLEECVDNLVKLASFDSRNEGVAAQQVEVFARYVTIDPWQISRMICADELGKAGVRLELAQHPPQSYPGPVATPEAVADALSPLIRAVTGPASSHAEPELAAACRGMAELNYDLDGLLRALSASTALLRREGRDFTRRAPLYELVVGLERRTVTLALERAASDSNAHVRAAALHALVLAQGPAGLARALARLDTEPDPLVQLSLLELIRTQGLPAAPGEDAKAAASEREQDLARVYRVATQHSVERVRVSAMQTLGAVSGAGFTSLREEDWQSWWYSRAQPAAR
ncbi:MAG TPA: hypothetical protein VM509_09285 [Planctomycetota bacterium]|nr:hypothetical protein [Planctomycetota bacterium]